MSITTLGKWLYYKIYLHSFYWHWLHDKAGKNADWNCEVDLCTKHGRWLDAHHVTYKILWLEFFFQNKMVYLCPHHHQATHAGAYLNIRNGQILPPYKKGKIHKNIENL